MSSREHQDHHHSAEGIQRDQPSGAFRFAFSALLYGATATGFATCALSIIKGSSDQLMTMPTTFSFLPARVVLGLNAQSPENLRLDAPLATREVRELLGSAILCHG